MAIFRTRWLLLSSSRGRTSMNATYRKVPAAIHLKHRVKYGVPTISQQERLHETLLTPNPDTQQSCQVVFFEGT